MPKYFKKGKNNKELGQIYKSPNCEAPVLKYFFSCRPDLTDRMLVEQATMFKDLVDSRYKYHAVSCGRGFAKTMIASGVALYFADEWSTEHNRPINVLLVSSQRALYDNIEVFFRNRPDLGERLKNKSVWNAVPKEGIEFKDNHSKLIPAMATVHAVEGNRADVIIIDETQDIKEEVILKALGCLRKDTLGIVIIIGTPYTEIKGLSWFIELIKEPRKFLKEKPFHLTQYSSELTTWNDVDLWRSAWSKERFDAECRGIVTSIEERSYFGGGNVKKCCLDIPPDPEGGMNSTREVGIDCGYNDTVYILTEKIGSVKRKVLFIAWWKKRSIEEIAPEIAHLINVHQPNVVKMDSKTGSIANYKKEIKKYTQKTIILIDASLKFVTEDQKTISVKDAMRGQLLRKMREGNNLIISMRLEHAEALKDQLLKYNPKHTRNDDLVDGLMISCYEPMKGLGGQFGRVSFPKSITVIHKADRYGFRK